jgi:hypothetical protein
MIQMEVAHIIMAYKNPSQVERLVQQLVHPHCDVFIHLDKKVDISDFRFLEAHSNVYFIENRVTCNWGGFSFVRAISASVRQVLGAKKNYNFINLLSGQDYPLKSSDYIYSFLKGNMGKSFISYEMSSDSPWWKHAVTRYENFHLTDFNIRGRYRFQRLLNAIFPKRKFPLAVKLYGSADASWWTLSRDCAAYIIDQLDTNPKLMRFMSFTWAGDEFLFPTLIMNSPFQADVINNNLRHIVWEGASPNPKIFTIADLDLLKGSNRLFARKFDQNVDSEILEKLDALINPLLEPQK